MRVVAVLRRRGARPPAASRAERKERDRQSERERSDGQQDENRNTHCFNIRTIGPFGPFPLSPFLSHWLPYLATLFPVSFARDTFHGG